MYFYDNFLDAKNKTIPYSKNLLKELFFRNIPAEKLPNNILLLCIDEYPDLEFRGCHLIKVLVKSKIFYVYY
jgi:hypothetical protein